MVPYINVSNGNLGHSIGTPKNTPNVSVGESVPLNFLWLEITRKCNLQCVHCYADSSPFVNTSSELKFDDWATLLRDAARIGCRSVQFIGGEPTVFPRYMELVALAKELGFDLIEIYTNATRLTVDVCESLHRHGVSVATSFYAPDSDIHDRVTQNKGSFDRTVAGIRNVIQVGLPIRVGIVQHDFTSEKVTETEAFLRNLGVKSIRVDRVRGVGRGGSAKANCGKFSEYCGSCSNGKLAINPEGFASPCVFSRENVLGHASDGLETIVHGTKLESFRRDYRAYIEECTKDHGHSCPPCFPSRCDPDICNPDNCVPLD